MEVIEGILNKLINYVTTHFKAEEFLFEEFGYPDRKEHIEEHNEFIKKVIKLKRDYDSGKLTLTSKVVVYLSEWADDHIRGLDQEYSAFFMGKV